MYTHTHTLYIKSLRSLEKSGATDMLSRVVRAKIARLLVKSSGKLVAKVVRVSSTSVRLTRALSLSPPPLLPLPAEHSRMQQPARRAAIFRTSASRRTFPDYKRGFAQYRARVCCMHTCICVCTPVRGDPGLQCDLRRMKVSRMDVGIAPRSRRNDISRRKFEG